MPGPGHHSCSVSIGFTSRGAGTPLVEDSSLVLAKLACLSEAAFGSGNAQEVEMKKQLVSIVSCVGLVSAGVVGVSAPSSAAVGETKIFSAASILGNGSTILEIAASRGGRIHGY